MSASNTNLKKQKRRHKGPLIGMAVAVGVAAILFLIYLLFLADPEVDDPAVELTDEEPAEILPEAEVLPDADETDETAD